jgi:hypothetical protein
MRVLFLACLLIAGCGQPDPTKQAAATERPSAAQQEPLPKEDVGLVMVTIGQDEAGNLIENAVVVYGGEAPGEPQMAGSFLNGRLMEVLICDTRVNPPTCLPIESVQDPDLEAQARAMVMEIYDRLGPAAKAEARRNYREQGQTSPETGVPGITNIT